MAQEERNKQTDRIKKILALASDPSITNEEQDNYRKRARILMEKYALAHLEDANLSEVEKQVIEVDFKPYAGLVIDANLFVVLPHILDPICRYFGCFVIIHTGVARIEKICGFAPNIELVQYAANVVLKQGRDEYKRLYRMNRSITFGQSFWSGFALGIQKKFKLDKSEQTEVGIVLYDKVKAKADEITGGRTTTTQIDMSRPDFMNHGEKFGENVTIHTALGDTNKGNLLG